MSSTKETIPSKSRRRLVLGVTAGVTSLSGCISDQMGDSEDPSPDGINVMLINETSERLEIRVRLSKGETEAFSRSEIVHPNDRYIIRTDLGSDEYRVAVAAKPPESDSFTREHDDTWQWGYCDTGRLLISVGSDDIEAKSGCHDD